MKKICSIGLLAICCVALSHQEASAWINTRFGIGLGYQWQSGGNSFGHIWQNGQVPGPEAYGVAPSYYPYPQQYPTYAPPVQYYSPHHQVQSGYAGYGPQPIPYYPHHHVQSGYSGYGH